MPLAKTISPDSDTKLYLWEITEDFQTLAENLELNPRSLSRLNAMRSQAHQCGFLSIRHLLAVAGYTDFDLKYDANGKPHLADGKFISITHSHQYSAIIVSNRNVGIDLEKQREKITRIAHKFINAEEHRSLREVEFEKIRQLTAIWGAKEALFKMCDSRSLSFKQDMEVTHLNWDEWKGQARISTPDFSQRFSFSFFEFSGFTAVYAFEESQKGNQGEVELIKVLSS